MSTSDMSVTPVWRSYIRADRVNVAAMALRRGRVACEETGALQCRSQQQQPRGRRGKTPPRLGH